MSRTRMALFAVALTGLLFLGCHDSGDRRQPSTVVPTPTLSAPLVYPDSPVIGPKDAKVTLVEFLDPECEACRAAYPDVKALLEQYPNDLRLVVRYFPLHRNSVAAAIATEAAGEQGQYEEMQRLLFERQSEWGEQQADQTEVFVGYATQLGLDSARFRAAMANPEYRQKIDRDRQDGISLGVTGTPTFFVDGTWIPRPSPTALRAAIEAARQR